MDLEREHQADYEALKDDSREDERTLLLEDYAQHVEAKRFAPRLTQKAKSAVVAHACQQLESTVREQSFSLRSVLTFLQMKNLSKRVGVEGFFCVVRNNTAFHMDPMWFFTSQGIEDYLPVAIGRVWDTGAVGTQLEAFSIAGGDMERACRFSLLFHLC